MNPTRVSATAYRSYERLDVALPEGCVAIIGENGSGKSSLVQLIELCLFGGKLAQYHSTSSASTEMEIQLEAEHADAIYRIRRGFSARSRKSLCDFERLNGDGQWTSLTLGSQVETQALIERTFGFSKRTFTASSFLRQGDAGAFTEADPSIRKKILADVLGLDRFDRLLAACRRDKRQVEQQVAMIDGRLQGADADELATQRSELAALIQTLASLETQLIDQLAEAETALEQATAAAQAAQTRAAERAAAEARVQAATGALEARTQLGRNAAIATTEAERIRANLAALPEASLDELEQREQQLLAHVEAHREAVRAREDALRLSELRRAERDAIASQAQAAAQKAAELDRKIVHLEAGDLDTCPTCEQQLGTEARATTIGSLRAQAQQAAEEARALQEQADGVEIPDVPMAPVESTAAAELELTRAQLRSARETGLLRSRLDERLAGHDRTVAAAAEPAYLAAVVQAEADLAMARAALDALEPVADFEQLRAAAVHAGDAVTRQRAEIARLQRDKAVEEERFTQIEQRIAQHTMDLEERARLVAVLDVLAVLERAYGPDGIPSLIVENAAIPQVETEANRILVMLAGTTAGCRLELRTGREKADGSVRDDVLDVILVTEDGERPYETFSGGERTRLNLALRIALARLLATRRGAESRLLAIDEPEYLDTDGTEALAEVLRELEVAGVFDRIYLVSHVPALRDSFDVVLQVVKENGRSRIVGAPEPVEVAA